MTLWDRFETEAEMHAAYEADPKGMRVVIDAEIAYWSADGKLDRDHSAREYVALLRRVGRVAGGDDPHVEHERRMRAAMARLKLPAIEQPEWVAGLIRKKTAG